MTIDADVQLSGPIAQFGRTGIINETAAILIGQFAKNIEAMIASIESGTGADIDVQGIRAGSVAWQVMKSKLFRREKD